MQKLEDAERHYRIAMTLNPTNSTLLVCVGVVLERLQNRHAALAHYSKALELTPHSSLARFKKARVLMHLKQYDMALRDLEVLKSQASDEANVWFLLGKCYKGMGNRSGALRALTTALNLDVKVGFSFCAFRPRRLGLKLTVHFQAAPFIKEAIEALDDDVEDGDDDSDDD
jgi:anaphase-promoting complex subunit 3